MTPQMVIEIGREALTVTLLVAAPMLIFGLIIGLIISVFQAVTQINEMTLTFVPKILAVALALLMFMPWMINMLTDFTRHMFDLIPTLVGV
jgi:flagellar biosynthesis protein FliQ